MAYQLGRLLQLVGLLLLPIALAGNMANRVSLGTMLGVVVLGVLVFYIGRGLQGNTKSE